MSSFPSVSTPAASPDSDNQSMAVVLQDVEQVTKSDSVVHAVVRDHYWSDVFQSCTTPASVKLVFPKQESTSWKSGYSHSNHKFSNIYKTVDGACQTILLSFYYLFSHLNACHGSHSNPSHSLMLLSP
jgi:hypothetical protein